MVKLSVNVSNETLDVLRWLARVKEITMTEAIKDAIGAAQFIEEAKRRGDKILTEDKDGHFLVWTF